MPSSIDHHVGSSRLEQSITAIEEQRHGRPVEDDDNHLLEERPAEDGDDDFWGEEDAGILNAPIAGEEDDARAL